VTDLEKTKIDPSPQWRVNEQKRSDIFMNKSNLRVLCSSKKLNQSHFKFSQSIITLVILLGFTMIFLGLSSCGGGGGDTAAAVTPTNTDCVLGTSNIGDCTI
jgi:hypothetical protein